MINQLLNIPDNPLSVPEYREWIDTTEQAVKESCKTYDRHTAIKVGFTLEEALTPGIYTRKLTMLPGALIFSKIHLQEHPFVITKGKVSVYDGEKCITIEAPYNGITKPGTKRVLYVHDETVWITFHPVENETLEDCDKNGVITCETFQEFERGVKCLL